MSRLAPSAGRSTSLWAIKHVARRHLCAASIHTFALGRMASVLFGRADVLPQERHSVGPPHQS